MIEIDEIPRNLQQDADLYNHVISEDEYNRILDREEI